MLHLANGLLLASYLARDILWLRLLTLASLGCLLALDPVGEERWWLIAFAGINAVHVVWLAVERRPLRLSDDEQRLHELVFTGLGRKQLRALFRAAQWRRLRPAETLIFEGQRLDRLMVLADGRAIVSHAGQPVGEVRPGGFLGEVSFLTGQPASGGVVTVEHTRVATWPGPVLRELLAADPQLQAVLDGRMGVDLARKLGG